MRKLLQDLAPGQQYAVQFRSYDGDGYSDWSQILYFETTSDTIAPGPIENLHWNVVGGTFVASWDKVVLDENGGYLSDFRDYQVTISDSLTDIVYYQTSESFSFTPDENQAKFGSIRSTLTITVEARDHTGNLGTAATATATDPIPPQPSDPIVSTYLGQIAVEWNGKSKTGLNMPYNFARLEIHVSTTSGFTPSASTLNDRLYSKGKILLSNLAFGTTYYIRFVALSTLADTIDSPTGVSPPSVQASGVSARISGLDIQNGTISTDQINFVDQLGGPKAFYQTTAPTTGMKTNDIWYDKDDGYKPYKYNGTTWVVDPDIGFVSGTRIVAGTITSDQIGTNKIITAAANIGTAVIDGASIISLDAAKITVGVLKSGNNVTFGGVSRPAWQIDLSGIATFSSANILGELVIGNAADTAANNAQFVLKSHNYLPAQPDGSGGAGWAIKGDGNVEFNSGVFRGSLGAVSITGGTITGGTISTATLSAVTITGVNTLSGATLTGGTIQTAASGSRVVQDSTGVKIWNGSTNTINLSTSGMAIITGLYKSAYSGQRVEINSTFSRPGSFGPGSIYSGMRIYGASESHFGEIGVGDDGNFYTLQMISPLAGANNGAFLRLKGSGVSGEYDWAHLHSSRRVNISCIGNTTIQGNTGVSITYGSTSNIQVGATIGVWSNSTLELSAGGGATIMMYHSQGSLRVQGNNGGSPSLAFAEGGAVQLQMKATTPAGQLLGLSVINAQDSDYVGIRAGGFVQSSDVSLKTAIAPVESSSALLEIVGTQVYDYNLISDDRTPSNGRRNRGIIAQEAPESVRHRGMKNAENSERLEGVDLYAMAATSWGAIKALYDTIEMLKQRITELENPTP